MRHLKPTSMSVRAAALSPAATIPAEAQTGIDIGLELLAVFDALLSVYVDVANAFGIPIPQKS